MKEMSSVQTNNSLCRVCVLDFVIILQGSYVIRCTCPADDFDKNEYGSLILGVFV